MKEVLTEKNHARIIVYANTLAKSVELNPTPGNIRKWRYKMSMILKTLDVAGDEIEEEDMTESDV